jgi:hypothetical protein
LTLRTHLGRKSHLNICATLGIWVGHVRHARNARLTSRTRLGRKSHVNICATLGIWVGRVRRARNARSISRTRSRRKSHSGRPQNPFGEPLLTKSTKKHTFVKRPNRALDALGRARFGRTRARGVRGRLG